MKDCQLLLVVFFIVVFFSRFVELEKVIGNEILTWGCNSGYVLGRTDIPTGCFYPDTDFVKFPTPLINDSSIRGKLVTHMKACSRYTMLKFHSDDVIYIFGTLVTNGVDIVKSSMPHASFNISAPLELDRMDCTYYPTLFTTNGNVYSRMSDAYGILGIGYNHRYPKTTPVFFLYHRNIQHLMFGARIGLMTNDSRNVYVSGRNQFLQFGIAGEYRLETYMSFKKTNMSAMIQEAGNIQLLHIGGRFVLVLFDNMRMYYWGDGSRLSTLGGRSLLGENEFSVHYPVLCELLHSQNNLSSIPDTAEAILDLQCGAQVCFMLVKLNSTTNEVFSWGHPYEWISGRVSDEYNWAFPNEISRGERRLDENIISMGIGPSIMIILTTKGNLYSFGQNERYLGGHPDDFGGRFYSPTLIVDVRNVSYISYQKSDEYRVALASSHSCFGFFPGNYLACSGHGSCHSHDNCICIDDYTGEMCEIPYLCYEFYMDEPSVCNGWGVCARTDHCECLDAEGDDCKIPLCAEKNPSHPHSCSKHGNCIAPNECECHKNRHFYGLECNEKIWRARLSFDESSVIVNYEINIYLLEDVMKEIFDCSLVVSNFRNFENNATCFFDFESYLTQYLVITFDKTVNSSMNLDAGRTVILHPVTKRADEVTLTISPTSIFEEFWYLFVILIGVIVVVVSVVVASLIIVCTCYVIRLQKKKIQRFSELKDFDLLLEEQKASETNDSPKVTVDQTLFQIQYEELKLIKEIGHGSQSKVYLVNWKEQIVCLKMHSIGLSPQWDEFSKETSILSSLRHPYVLTMYGFVLRIKGTITLGYVSEWCQNGSLKTYILKMHKVSIQKKLNILSMVSSAMYFLHTKAIVHRDLNPSNVLFSNDWTIRIIDFGLSKILEDISAARSQTRHVGTSYYSKFSRFFINLISAVAPECVVSNTYNHLVDVFSMSMIMWEMYYERSNPFIGMDGSGIEFRIARDPKFRPQINKEEIPLEDEWYVALMRKCWDGDPKKRPQTFKEIVMEIKEHQTDEKEESEKVLTPREYEEIISRLKGEVDLMKSKNIE